MVYRRSRILLVSEIFQSVQGEGVSAGIPAVFLRLAICNLHCWYCDTKYTWLYNRQLLELVQAEVSKLGVPPVADLFVYDSRVEVNEIPIDIVAERILRYDCPRLIVTGGEPLIQQIPLQPLLSKLKAGNRDFFVEVETNGTIAPSPGISGLVDQWNVSPKLASAGNGSAPYERVPSLGAFKKLNSYFKFVITNNGDLHYCEEFLERHSIPKDRVILMPEGTRSDAIIEKTGELSDYCKMKGYKFSSRLQILMYGNKRGT